MSHRCPDCVPVHLSVTTASADLFAWSGGEIVLFAERCDDRWVVARGWRDRDRLGDVRRWSFADARRFVGQVRRLAHEATGDLTAARAAAAAAQAWADPAAGPAAA